MRLRLVRTAEEAAAVPAAEAPPPEAPDRLGRATADQRARAARRAAAVDRSDELHAAGRGRVDADRTAGAEIGASGAAVARWRKLSAGLDRGARIEALLDSPRPGRPPAGWTGRGAGELWAMWLEDRLREGPDGVAVDGAGVHRRLADVATARGWELPPLHAFMRREKRETTRRERVRAAQGALAFGETQPRQRRSVADLELLEIVNGDGRRIDVLVEFPSGRVGRPVVWLWQDVRSRRLLEWEAGEVESADIVRTSLHRLIVDVGVPGSILVDNTRAASARWLTGGQRSRRRWRSSDEELPGILQSLDIRYRATGVDRDAAGRGQGRGWAKPVERAFKDLKGQVEQHPACAGALTGRSPLARPETHRQRAMPWQDFLDVWARAVDEYNARRGRRMEIAAGRSVDDVWAEEFPALVVRRLTPRQAALLLLAAEDPKVRGDGTFALQAGRAARLPPNRYRARELVEHAGRRVVARFDPAALHAPCQVYDLKGRWICEAECHQAVAFDDAGAARELARERRRERRHTEGLDRGQAPHGRPARGAAGLAATGARRSARAGRGRAGYRARASGRGAARGRRDFPAAPAEGRRAGSPGRPLQEGGFRMTESPRNVLLPFRPPAGGDQTVDEVRADLADYIQVSGLSIVQVAREIGRGASEGVLSPWIRGVYSGDPAAVARRVAAWLESRRDLDARSLDAAGLRRHVELGASEEVAAALAHAHAGGDMVLVHGPSGSGKSWAAERYCNTRPGATYIYMTAAVRSPRALLRRVAAAVGAGDGHHSAVAAEEAVISKLARRRAVLVVDEADHLPAAELDELRCIRDISGAGLALIGRDDLWTRMAGNERCSQIVGRIRVRVALDLPSEADTAAMARSALGREPSPGEMSILFDAARGDGGFHALTGLLQVAWIAARGAGADGIRAEDLAAAREAA